MALSLTEIRDAFVQEGDEDGHAFGAATIPTQLPDHQKKSSPVGPRLIHEKEFQDQRRDARRSARKRALREPEEKTGRCSGDIKKLTINALAFTSGLALHHAVVNAMCLYFDAHYTSSWNKACATFIYPVTVILILWSIKNSGSR